MGLNWIDVSTLPFNALMLLERVQLSWFPGWVPEPELSLALRANPAVEWYLRHKCPPLNPWLDKLMTATETAAGLTVRQAEMTVMETINDLLVYVVNPAIYDAQPFLAWNPVELASLTDFAGKTAIDVGAGTGKLTLIAAAEGAVVFAVEPVAHLRYYLKEKARESALQHIYVVDGLVTGIPFPDHFADVTMGGHVFGDDPEAEFQEMARVTKPGGILTLCPGNNDLDNARHDFLLRQGCQWSRFEEPGAGLVRKYWRTISKGDRVD